MLEENSGLCESEIIALAWCDKTDFSDIYAQTGLTEKEVMTLMRRSLKPSSYRLWRKRVHQISRKKKMSISLPA